MDISWKCTVTHHVDETKLIRHPNQHHRMLDLSQCWYLCWIHCWNCFCVCCDCDYSHLHHVLILLHPFLHPVFDLSFFFLSVGVMEMLLNLCFMSLLLMLSLFFSFLAIYHVYLLSLPNHLRSKMIKQNDFMSCYIFFFSCNPHSFIFSSIL